MKMTFKTTISTFIVLTISLTVIGQSLDKREMELYRKIEYGQYSKQDYIKAILKKEYNSDFEEYRNKYKGTTSSLVSGLINKIIQEDYDSKIQLYSYPMSFKTYSANEERIFYESAQLRNDGELFIWGEYFQETDSFSLKTQAVFNLEEGQTYELTVEQFNNDKTLVFFSREIAVVGSDKLDNWGIIKIKFDQDTNYVATYRNCNLLNDTIPQSSFSSFSNYKKHFPQFDTLPKSKGMSFKADNQKDIMEYFKSDEHQKISAYNDSVTKLFSALVEEVKKDIPQRLRLYYSDIEVADLNNDGTKEIFWYCISNGVLVNVDIYEFKNGKKLIRTKLDDNMKQYLKQSDDYVDLAKMSRMKKVPDL